MGLKEYSVASMKQTENQELMRMALVGYEAQRAALDGKIAELRGRLQGVAPIVAKKTAVKTAPKATTTKAANNGPKRQMSEEGRKRIAEAQRKRWAAAKAAA